MAKKRGLKSRFADARAPEWEPLLDLAPEHVADFMWMGALEFNDGTRIQAYKHYWTRGYVHLDGDGRAFAMNERDLYEEIDPVWVLRQVLREYPLDHEDVGFLPPRRFEPAEVRLEWADSAAKNGISRERADYVIRHCGLRYVHRAPFEAERSRDYRFLFLGRDEVGVELEVAAIERGPEADFLVFHAALLRDEYQGWFARCRSWAG